MRRSPRTSRPTGSSGACWRASRRRTSPPSAPSVPSTGPERLLDRLDWQVVRRLDGDLQGDYATLFRGHGMDIAGLREYQPGDDVRTIDWNVTARMPVPYV